MGLQTAPDVDEVRIAANDACSQSGICRTSPTARIALDDEVLPLNVAKPTKLLEESPIGLVGTALGHLLCRTVRMRHRDAVTSCGFLCACPERQTTGGNTQQRQEF